MTEVTATEMRDNLSDLLNLVAFGKEPVVIQRRQKKLATIISYEDWCLFQRLLADAEDRHDAAEARRILEDPNTKWVDWETAKKELEA